MASGFLPGVKKSSAVCVTARPPTGRGWSLSLSVCVSSQPPTSLPESTSLFLSAKSPERLADWPASLFHPEPWPQRHRLTPVSPVCGWCLPARESARPRLQPSSSSAGLAETEKVCVLSSVALTRPGQATRAWLESPLAGQLKHPLCLSLFLHPERGQNQSE